MELLGRKMDEITQKLDTIADIIENLVTITKTMNEQLGENVKKLVETIDKYTDSTNQRSNEDFELTRTCLADVTKEITTLNQATGIEQLMRMNQALNGILALLEQNIDPNSIQEKLLEITQFIKQYGGR